MARSTLQQRNEAILKRNDKAQQQNWTKRGYINSDGTPFSRQDYDKMLKTQNNYCAFPGCTHTPQANMPRFSADTDHTTHIVRGILCNECNANLVGNHTIKSAEALLTYLKSREISQRSAHTLRDIGLS